MKNYRSIYKEHEHYMTVNVVNDYSTLFAIQEINNDDVVSLINLNIKDVKSMIKELEKCIILMEKKEVV